MTSLREGLTDIVIEAIQDVNRLLPIADRIEPRVDTILSGPDGRLDSLGIVNLIVATEEKLERQMGVQVTLIDDEQALVESNPFQTVGHLIQHIERLLGDRPA